MEPNHYSNLNPWSTLNNPWRIALTLSLATFTNTFISSIWGSTFLTNSLPKRKNWFKKTRNKVSIITITRRFSQVFQKIIMSKTGKVKKKLTYACNLIKNAIHHRHFQEKFPHLSGQPVFRITQVRCRKSKLEMFRKLS